VKKQGSWQYLLITQLAVEVRWKQTSPANCHLGNTKPLILEVAYGSTDYLKTPTAPNQLQTVFEESLSLNLTHPPLVAALPSWQNNLLLNHVLSHAQEKLPAHQELLTIDPEGDLRLALKSELDWSSLSLLYS
jgi:hypothetical protein